MNTAVAGKVDHMWSGLIILFTIFLTACDTLQRSTSKDTLSQAEQRQLRKCPSGRIVTDPFGYPACQALVRIQEASPPEKGPQPHESSVRVPAADIQANERRAGDDLVCRQYSEVSLSAAYLVYRQCMEDKGWPSTSQ